MKSNLAQRRAESSWRLRLENDQCEALIGAGSAGADTGASLPGCCTDTKPAIALPKTDGCTRACQSMGGTTQNIEILLIDELCERWKHARAPYRNRLGGRRAEIWSCREERRSLEQITHAESSAEEAREVVNRGARMLPSLALAARAEG